MKKCLIWKTNDEYNLYYNQLLFEEFKGNISIEGIIARDEYVKYIDGKEVIDEIDIFRYEFDYIIVFDRENFINIKNKAIKLGVQKNKLIDGSRVFSISNFDFNKYCSLLENPITIISDDCWGGIVSHYLGLEFNSPFVNMFLRTDDYIKFLDNMDYYLNEELCMEEEGDVYSCSVPIGSLGDGKDKIRLYFNHHVLFSEAKKDWDRRKRRINMNNLFIKITLQNDNEILARRFDKLQYKNKICFCPKELDYDSTIFLPSYIWRSINECTREGSNAFSGFVNNMKYLSKSCDILKMLCGEKNFIREK